MIKLPQGKILTSDLHYHNPITQKLQHPISYISFPLSLILETISAHIIDTSCNQLTSQIDR